MCLLAAGASGGPSEYVLRAAIVHHGSGTPSLLLLLLPMMPAHCRFLLAVDLPSVSSRASVLRAGLGKGHYTAFAKPGPAIERGRSPGPGDEEPAPGTGEWGACRREIVC